MQRRLQKKLAMKVARRLHRQTQKQHPHQRQGSALMIVMVLIGMLSLLGVLFYTFAAQERSNANYYSDAAKNLGAPSLTADILFDWGLEQIIVGTDRRLTNSALYGSRHSMLSNLLGFGTNAPGDIHVSNGDGVNVIYDTSGNIAVDQNRNGLPDDGVTTDPVTGFVEPDNSFLLNYNDSPAALRQQRQVTNGNFPQSDVGYSYPDINNVFLTYVGKVRDFNGNVHKVVKPAYLTPGLYRASNGTVSAPLTFEDTNLNGILDTGEDLNGNGVLDDWCVNPNLAARTMRAHPSHIYIPSSGVPAVANQVKRYLNDTEAVSLIGPTAHGFPFHPMDPTYTNATPVYMKGRMGAYTAVTEDINNNGVLDPGEDQNGNGIIDILDAPVEFDYDNDGDGFKESILMDLDFPPQQDASGKLFVPLFLITIHDLDALINLNAHGNLAKILLGPNDIGQATVPIDNSTYAFGTSTSGTPAFYPVSQSNLGLSPSEVNPFWALTARAGTDNAGATVFNQHTQFFGMAPQALSGTHPLWNVANPVFGETANMELAWAKMGRLDFSTSGTGQLSDVTALLPGVYGEENLLYRAKSSGSLTTPGGLALPRPGISLVDDNNDANEGQGMVPYFQHPLDFSGLGSYRSFTATPAGAKTMNRSTAVGLNQWIAYTGYGNTTTGLAGNVGWSQTTSPMPQLMNSSITQGLGDDPNEVLYYTANNSIDQVFGPDEQMYLSLSNQEIARLNITSRLSRLFPFNFAKTVGDNTRGEVIRHKFGVESNDRKSFSLPKTVRAFGPTTSGQEYNLDNVSGTIKFPPQFGTIPRYQTTAKAEDPLRIATRFLLEIELNSQQSQSRPQRKLSINQFLTGDTTNPLAYRQLSPHPVNPGAAPISQVPGAYTYPPTTPDGQEYWARFDRQKMARDIYVLLYLLGHGDDAVNTAKTSNTSNAIYSDTQLREMAQFAVNVVDSLDRDNVMTKFEYDKDLSDGWNLDDNPYGLSTNDGTWVDPNGVLPSEPYATPYPLTGNFYNPSYPNDGAHRGEVFGIEKLDLFISESMVLQVKKGASGDNVATSVDEGANDRYFFHVELRNQSPFPVKFGPNETWAVVLKQEATAALPAWERRLVLLDPTIQLDGTYPDTPTNKTFYVIGSGDSSTASVPPAFKKSTFAVNTTGTTAPTAPGTSNFVIPNNASGICDLDLIETTPLNVFRIDDGKLPALGGNDLTATAGAMLNAFTGGIADMTNPPSPGQSPTVKVLLRRKAHPTRSLVTANETDNPYVEIDSMMLQAGSGFQIFDLAQPIATALGNAKSRERPQPLDGTGEGLCPTADSVNASFNTFGKENILSAGALFNLWQLHFDRDYASVMDLLYVPVFGPHQLTMLGKAAYAFTPEQQVTLANAVPSPNWQVGPVGAWTPYSMIAKLAAAKFMVPEDPANAVLPTPTFANDNRWHRLLELLEVPSRTNVNLGLGTDLAIPRVPGRMNLNMLRNPENFAALLDDPRILQMDLAATPVDPDAPSLTDTDEIGRDWWRNFLMSRDPIDPYWANQATPIKVPLPGLPNASAITLADGSNPPDARPFRSLADVRYYYNPANPGVKHSSVADTVFRNLPMDAQPPIQTTKRTLFEVGKNPEHQAGTIDPYIRNKFLAKIAGNTTTRSNCFGVFISVKYFQAVQDNGAVRIGGPYNGKAEPEHRGFFVIDRSKLESGQTSIGPTFDFRSFVDYRVTLQTQ